MNLLFTKPTTCGWCLTLPATTYLYTVPSCLSCATATSKQRVTRWQQAVYNRNNRETGT